MDTTRFNSWENQKDQFQDYVNKWEDALKKGIFETPKNSNDKKEDTFFDLIKKEPTLEFNPNDLEYWQKIQDMSVGNSNVEIINEASKKEKQPKEAKPEKDSKANFELVDNSLKNDKEVNNIIKKAKKLADNPNPVYQDSYGKDTTDESGKTRVTSGFSADDRLPQLQDLYKALYQLEVKMSDKDGLSEKLSKDMQKKITEVKKLISKISDSLDGDFESSTDYN